MSLTGRGPRPRSVSPSCVRHIRPSQLNSSRRYTYLARYSERSPCRWSCSPLSSKVSNFVTPRMYIEYYSIDDDHWPMRGATNGPRWTGVWKNNESASAVPSRNYLSHLLIVAARYFLARWEFSARQNQCEDIIYCASRKARLCTDLFRNRRSASDGREAKRWEEYRRGAPPSSFLNQDRTKRGSSVLRSSGSLSPAAAAPGTPIVCPIFLASLFYRFIPESLEFHLEAIDYTLAWPMIITSFEQSFRTRE